MKPAEVSTPSDKEVLVTRSFDSPVDLVWQAYTEPALMKRWLIGPPGWCMPVCDMDLRVGGKYRWRWRNDAEGTEFGFDGEFLEVVDQSKIVHTQRFIAGNLNESMGQEGSIVSVSLQEANGITTAVTSIQYATKEDRDAAFSTGMTEGMEMSYQALDKVLADSK